MSAESSIAEMNSIEYLLSMVRDIEDILGGLSEEFDAYRNGNAARLYPRIRDLKNRVEDSKVMVMEYLTRTGEALLNARSYTTIAQALDRIAQLTDGAAYRLTLLEESRVGLDSSILNSIRELIEIAKRQVQLIRDSLDKLRLNPKKSVLNCNEISKLEASADELYRRTTFNLYKIYNNNILALMVGKEIIDFIEEISDSAKIIGEEIRFIALMKSASI
ncbi:DUF47 domain-containing protein [Thermogladius sp. 4427co]|uniref:DUF47 domain-containing protein n=1 Tax=Thermogladius sp. 4427co TaxID=3450718 RepID=UPI003F79E2BA